MAAGQYLSNGLISPKIKADKSKPINQSRRERNLAEPKAPSILSKALNAAWVRPFLFLIFIVVVWDLSIRLFKIPAYQIPAPADVVAVLWQEWPGLARQGRAAPHWGD